MIWSLTPDQFKDYLEIEVEAQIEERWLGAVGVVTGIASAFGKKNNKALEKYRSVLEGEANGSGAPEVVQTLRDKVIAKLPPGSVRGG